MRDGRGRRLTLALHAAGSTTVASVYEVVVPTLQTDVDCFLAHQNWLHDYGIEISQALYPVTIKSHYLWHMPQDARWYSPRLGWTYLDEDFVGRVAALCRSVTRSVANVQRPRKLLNKWLLAMAVQWSDDAGYG